MIFKNPNIKEKLQRFYLEHLMNQNSYPIRTLWLHNANYIQESKHQRKITTILSGTFDESEQLPYTNTLAT